MAPHLEQLVKVEPKVCIVQLWVEALQRSWVGSRRCGRQQEQRDPTLCVGAPCCALESAEEAEEAAAAATAAAASFPG